MSIRWLDRLDKGSVEGDTKLFVGKIDLDKVGIAGHSQGGVGVFNAMATQQHGSIYKTAVVLSPTKPELAHNLMWDYDPSKGSVPMLLLASTDEKAYVDPPSLRAIFDKLPGGHLRWMATRNNAEHNDMLFHADGYVTAWFMWQLQQNQDAAKAFTGTSPELSGNPLYQNQQVKQS